MLVNLDNVGFLCGESYKSVRQRKTALAWVQNKKVAFRGSPQDTYLEILQSVLQVALNVTRVVDKVCLEQSAHESDLVQELGLADELG